MRGMLVVAIVMAALPAWGFEGHFEGQASFQIGNRFCPTQGPALKFDVKPDGSVSGGVRTQNNAVPFNGSVASDGKLTASYKAGTDNAIVTVEAILTNEHLEGFTQSPSCRYKLSFDRQ